MRRSLFLLFPIALTGCEPKDNISRTPVVEGAQGSAVVDSVLPMDEALRRFRADIPLAATALSGGAPSRDELVQAFISALERGDTVSLGKMLITRAEFGYLYYPTSRASRPPYEEPPELNYLRSREHSGKGIRNSLRLIGGRPIHYLGYRCNPEYVREGENVLWGPCVVKTDTDSAAPVNLSLFGTIIERQGHYKFLSYGNQL